MVIDSSALLAILFREEEMAAFTGLILAADRRLLSTATLVEASMVALGVGEAFAVALDELLVELDVELMPLSAQQAAIARDAFRAYGKGRHKARLNLGDCFSYALAKATGEALLFKGNDFAQTDVTPAV